MPAIDLVQSFCDVTNHHRAIVTSQCSKSMPRPVKGQFVHGQNILQSAHPFVNRIIKIFISSVAGIEFFFFSARV